VIDEEFGLRINEVVSPRAVCAEAEAALERRSSSRHLIDFSAP